MRLTAMSMPQPAGSRARSLLLALLLSARTAAEWVEISQHHYAKPVRFATQDEPTPEQDPTRNTYIYHHVSLQNPAENTYLDRDVKPDRLNPFLQENAPEIDPTRNTYIYRDVSKNPTRNTYFDRDVLQKPIGDDFLNLDTPRQNPTKETYLNRSITEHNSNWNRNVHRQNNVRGDAKVTTKEPIYENTYRKYNDETRIAKKPDEIKIYEGIDSVTDIKKTKDETVSGKIERVPNIGSVKRVQLANTPVKSPTVKINKINDEINRRNYAHGNLNNDNSSDELAIETNIFKDSHVEKGSLNSSNNFKRVFSGSEEVKQEETPITHEDYSEITKVTNEEIKSTIKNFQRHHSTPKPDFDTAIAVVSKGHTRYEPNNVLSVVQTSVEQKEIKKYSTNRPQEAFSTDRNIPDYVTMNEKSTETEKDFMVETNEDKKDQHLNPYHGSVFEKLHIEEVKESSTENGEKINSKSGEIKVNTMESILKFIKVVADTISANTRRGANGKIAYLNELKHTLLANIKERIDGTWPDDNGVGTRHARAASPRGHVEFPSSESALMTISFLTFAVFLIKLVLQVIQTYKHKSMVMAPFMVATAKRALTKKLRAD